MKSGVHVKHLIFEAGEVIKDERCSASVSTHKKTLRNIKQNTHQTSPVGFKRVLAALSQFRSWLRFPDGLWVMDDP